MRCYFFIPVWGGHINKGLRKNKSGEENNAYDNLARQGRCDIGSPGLNVECAITGGAGRYGR